MCTNQLGGGVAEGMQSSNRHDDEEVWSNNPGNNNNVVVWREDEAATAGPSGRFSSPEHFQSPPVPLHHHQSQPVIFFVDDRGFDCQNPLQSRPRRVIFSHPNSKEEEIIDDSVESSSLQLTLTKSQEFIDLIEQTLSKRRMCNTNTHTWLDHDNSNSRQVSSRLEDYGSQPMSEKLKASNFPALLLKIGSWEKISKHEGDLVAKCYYAKRKLVWEILEGALKRKIEIQWTDIVGIRATMEENEPGLLEIELDKEPSYFKETDPQPRKHTLWEVTGDFTEGRAAQYRIHHVRFAPGVLDKHYEKLLQCHPKLKELSQEPFPSKPTLYFERERGIQGFADPPYFGQMPYPTLVPQAFPPAFPIFYSNPQMPGNNMMGENGRRIMDWGETSHGTQATRQPLVLPSTQVNNLNFRNNNNVCPRMSNPNMGMHYIENHLLNDVHNQTTFSDESMPMQYPLFDHLQMANSRIIGEQDLMMQPDFNVASTTHSLWHYGQEIAMQEPPISTTNLTYSYPMHAYNMHE